MTAPLLLFATKKDILDVLNAVEAAVSVRYVQAGMFDRPHATVFETASAIESLGIAATGDAAQERTFLIIDKNETVEVREVPQRRGGFRFSVDQQQNPASVGIRPGGEFGPGVLVAGQLGTSTEDPKSNRIFTVLERELSARFRKVKNYYLGPEAKKLLEGGGRLTANIRSSRAYDLKP